ncbi:MAG: tetratricopeptide repeat protein [Verrucomicrobiales bacterium]|nr:tetratricopeptide repeat protein [Verrucomicrobiales bacterium]
MAVLVSAVLAAAVTWAARVARSAKSPASESTTSSTNLAPVPAASGGSATRAASSGAGAERAPGEPTFNRDIAPILYAQCAPCHRPGETAPFDLLTYADAKKRSGTIVEVTRNRYMPPWLPEAGHEPLLDERRLSDAEIALIRRWVETGMAEGKAEDLPPVPKWTEGWVLGPPDLVLKLSEAYALPAEGADVYRNFVLPIPTRERRFVRAFEFRPSSRAVHHAFLRIDGTGQSRRIDEKEPGPGFAGMNTPPAAETPGGYFLSWQPGRLPSALPPGLAWSLPAGADLVLLMHMQLRGLPESVQPSIGFYFTDVPPTNTPVKIGLRSYAIDVPAGASEHAVEERVTLPVESELLAVLPHAHYLARRVEAYADIPGRERRLLMVIPAWDFNWQSDFRFAKPVALPAGTTLGMRFVYDNSTNNVRNPNQPPVRVKFGLQTKDEMGELWIQLLARDAAGRDRLETVAQMQTLKAISELSQFKLRENPEDAEAMAELAKVSLTLGDRAGAEAVLRKALGLRPELDDAHYHLGLVFLDQGKIGAAEAEFLEALRLNPEHFQARNNAGLACLRAGRLRDAAAHFREVLRTRPGDVIAQRNLDLVLRAQARNPAPR